MRSVRCGAGRGLIPYWNAGSRTLLHLGWMYRGSRNRYRPRYSQTSRLNNCEQTIKSDRGSEEKGSPSPAVKPPIELHFRDVSTYRVRHH